VILFSHTRADFGFYMDHVDHMDQALLTGRLRGPCRLFLRGPPWTILPFEKGRSEFSSVRSPQKQCCHAPQLITHSMLHPNRPCFPSRLLIRYTLISGGRTVPSVQSTLCPTTSQNASRHLFRDGNTKHLPRCRTSSDLFTRGRLDCNPGTNL